MTSIRDWQLQGVDIKVELATSGDLVAGGTITKNPLASGGVGGVPYGMSQWGKHVETDLARYNYTTASNVFSVSFKTAPAYQNLRAGAVSGEWLAKQGMYYELVADVRQMAGKQPAYKYLSVESFTGATWNQFYKVDTIALSDWETVAVATGSMGPGARMRYVLAGGKYPDNDGIVNVDWGVQFQNVYLRETAWGNGDVLPDLGWVDITCDTQDINIRYGREKFTERYDIGTVSVSLLNDEGIYSYHATHPLNLRPGRQVRVTATKDGVSYPMAFGIIDTIREAYSIDGRVLSIFDCVDPQTTLSNVTVKTTPLSIGLEESSFRARALFRQVGYPYWYVDTAVNIGAEMQKITASDRAVRDELGVMADSEGGSFLAERNGRLYYRAQWNPYYPQFIPPEYVNVTANMLAAPDMEDVPVVDDVPTLDGAPTICVNQLNVDWSQSRIINMVSLANAGSTVQEFVNEESVKAYGPHTYQRHDFLLLNDSQLQYRAAELMDGWSDPVLRVNSIGYAPGIGGDWDFALRVFLNWMLRVWYRNEQNRWGYAVALRVQSVEHHITPTDWSISMSVDQPVSFVELEDSEYGWDMGLWDEALWDQTDKAGALWSDPASTWSTAGDNWGE